MTRPDELAWEQAVDDGDFATAKALEAQRNQPLTINDELLVIGFRFGKGESVADDAGILLAKVEGMIQAGKLDPKDANIGSAMTWLEYFKGMES